MQKKRNFNKLILILCLIYSSVSLSCDSETVNKKIQLPVHDSEGNSALHLAVRGKFKPIVRYLLKSNIDPDQKNSDNFSALHVAAYIGDAEVVELLCKSNCDINVVDENGITSLHYACKLGHVEVVKKLLKFGANPNCYTHNDNQTPLLWSCVIPKRIWGKIKFHVMNASSGKVTPQTDPCEEPYAEIINLLVKYGADLQFRTKLGFQPIHWASYYGNTKLVMTLIDNGADLNSTTFQNELPHDLALSRMHNGLAYYIKSKIGNK